MKVIFLDIDGVLNGNLYEPQDNSGALIDETRLAVIKKIVDETGAKTVLSSSWREHWEQSEEACDNIGREINRIFALKQLSIFDKTPELHSSRKAEITEWLRRHPAVTGFVVIDDSPFEEDILKGHFVLTSRLRYGIDEYDMQKAIEILNSGGEI